LKIFRGICANNHLIEWDILNTDIIFLSNYDIVLIYRNCANVNVMYVGDVQGLGTAIIRRGISKLDYQTRITKY
jgi:hypothetical protein